MPKTRMPKQLNPRFFTIAVNVACARLAPQDRDRARKTIILALSYYSLLEFADRGGASLDQIDHRTLINELNNLLRCGVPAFADLPG